MSGFPGPWDHKELDTTEQLSHTHTHTHTHASVACFPGGTVEKNLSASAGDAREVDPIPGLGGTLEEGNGSPLQYSSLDNPQDKGAWRATVHRVAKDSDTTE